jgi:sugar diacid utilization regulator
MLSPIRTTSAALSQLLLCSQAHLPAVETRASEVGLYVGGWHCAARLTVDDPEALGAEGLSALEHEMVALVAEHLAPTGAVDWSVARPDDQIVLARTTRQPARSEAARAVRERMGQLAEQLRESHPGLRIRVGVGTAHEGAAGLRVSAEEARAALAAAQLVDDPVAVASFDALGTRRMLAEWLTTDAARDAVRELLAPLDAQGADKAATAVATLHAYLDEQGSLQRAAQRLHVHRNAVVYRLERIKALGIDLTDPDIRFGLQLACRARLMTTGRLDQAAPHPVVSPAG